MWSERPRHRCSASFFEGGNTMDIFMNPASIALIGVPRKTGVGAFNGCETMLRYGYQGRLYPINPKAGEICGRKSYASLADLPEQVDLAIISVGRDNVLPVLNDCVRAGIGRVLIITQGFADADEKGEKLQEGIAATARQHGIRIIGPNTIGIVNNYRHFTTSFVDADFPERFAPVSLIAQSGILQVADNNMAWHHWGKAIDIGNGCDIDFTDCLAYLGDDPETEVIVFYMEGMKRGEAFLRKAAEVTRRKPVIVFKSGRSRDGAKAALSHSGSLVGEDAVFDAAFRRAGIIRVRNAAEMKDAIHALLRMKEMAGPRLGIMTVTGAGGIMAVDACEDLGLEVAALPDGLARKLEEGTPDWIHVGHPIDIWPIGMIGGHYRDVSRHALTELFKSPRVDGVLSIFPTSASPLHTDLEMTDMVAQAREASGNGKPLAVWPYIDVASAVDRLEAIDGVACFDTIEQAVYGLSVCFRYHAITQRKMPEPGTFIVDRQALAPLLAEGRRERLLTGEAALALLSLFGIPVAKGAAVGSRKALLRAAASLQFPLVLKLSGPAFLHKSEWGGVITGITSRQGLMRACDTLAENVRRRNPGLTVDTFQVQEQTKGKELILGLKRDPQFGPVVACGLGGIYTEVFRDVSRELVPIDRDTAYGMLSSLKTYPLLAGSRGEPGVNLEAVVTALERLSHLAADIPDIAELDINPLIAAEGGCVAVDARIIW